VTDGRDCFLKRFAKREWIAGDNDASHERSGSGGDSAQPCESPDIALSG